MIQPSGGGPEMGTNDGLADGNALGIGDDGGVLLGLTLDLAYDAYDGIVIGDENR